MNKLILNTFFVLSILFISSCERENKDDEFYFKYKCEVVSINDNDMTFVGKNRTPTTCNVILIRSVNDTNLYTKLSSCSYHYQINLTDSNIYSKKHGSPVYFDYIRKDRFFHINHESL